MAKFIKNNKLKPNWKSNLIWTAISLIILGVLYMAIERKRNAQVETVKVSIKKIKGERDMITKKGVLTMFRNHLGYDLKESSIRDLDLMDMELFIEKDDRVKEAEVFVDNKDRLYIAILQREPILRVYNAQGKSYYLDIEGKIIPAFKGSTIRVPVASGMIEDYDAKLIVSEEPNTLKDVYTLASYIYEDEFLSALIEQIDVKENGEIMMVPKVGRQKLDFGTVENIEERFDKMKLLYKEGMEHVGWRKYEVLTLKYDSQSKGEESNYHLIYGEKK